MAAIQLPSVVLTTEDGASNEVLQTSDMGFRQTAKITTLETANNKIRTEIGIIRSQPIRLKLYYPTWTQMFGLAAARGEKRVFREPSGYMARVVIGDVTGNNAKEYDDRAQNASVILHIIEENPQL